MTPAPRPSGEATGSGSGTKITQLAPGGTKFVFNESTSQELVSVASILDYFKVSGDVAALRLLAQHAD